MVRSQLLTISLFLGILARSEPSQAEAAIPDPRAWAHELPETLWSSMPGLVRNFTLITKDAAQEKKWLKATENVPGLGFLRFVPSSALGFFRALNAAEDGTLAPEDASLAAVPVQIMLRDEGKINVQAMVKGQLKSLGKWGIKKEDRANGESFYRYVAGKLGYDAVVLDQKDDFILAATILNKTELGQGLLLKNSATKVFLKKGKQQGDALLQMLRIEGEFVVFESLLTTGQAAKIVPGSKILLGQSEQLKQMMGPTKGSKTAPATPDSPTPEKPEAPAEEEGAAPREAAP